VAPAPAPANKPLAHPPSKPAPKRKLSAVKAPKLGPLGLEETISIATALVILRGPFLILHVETTGLDTDHNEILAISAMRIDEGAPTAEFSVQVGEHGVTVQKAVTTLCAFLGNHRQHVFAHGAEAAQTLLGPAARQYGLQIENPIGDVVDLAKLAWPGRTDYSLSGLAADLRLASRSAPEAFDATKALLGVLMAASKQLTTTGGRVSSSLVHWGNSEDCVQIRMTPW